MSTAKSVFEEVILAYDPNNIYVQTIASILQAAEKLNLPAYFRGCSAVQ